MLTLYKAIDGKIFENKEECEQYEDKVRNNWKDAKLDFYTGEGAPMPIEPDSLKECSYIYVGNEKALDILTQFEDYSNCVVPPSCGLWRWDICEWVSLEETLEPWMSIYSAMCKIMNWN